MSHPYFRKIILFVFAVLAVTGCGLMEAPPLSDGLRLEYHDIRESRFNYGKEPTVIRKIVEIHKTRAGFFRISFLQFMPKKETPVKEASYFVDKNFRLRSGQRPALEDTGMLWLPANKRKKSCRLEIGDVKLKNEGLTTWKGVEAYSLIELNLVSTEIMTTKFPSSPLGQDSKDMLEGTMYSRYYFDKETGFLIGADLGGTTSNQTIILHETNVPGLSDKILK